MCISTTDNKNKIVLATQYSWGEKLLAAPFIANSFDDQERRYKNMVTVIWSQNAFAYRLN